MLFLAPLRIRFSAQRQPTTQSMSCDSSRREMRPAHTQLACEVGKIEAAALSRFENSPTDQPSCSGTFVRADRRTQKNRSSDEGSIASPIGSARDLFPQPKKPRIQERGEFGSRAMSRA
jgi:hypothetical protein